MKDILVTRLKDELQNLLNGQVNENSKVGITKLKVVVTGMEHSGTTFLSRLIIENSSLINSGFECGVLLSETPKKFNEINPFYEWFCFGGLGWDLTEDQRFYICDTDSFDEFYSRLFEICSIFKNGELYLLDKTPAYSYMLPEIIKKTPNVPILVVIKDIELLWDSYKKRNFSFEEFVERFLRFKKSLLDVLPHRNIKIVKLDEIVNYDAGKIEEIFQFLNLPLLEVKKLKNYNWVPLDPNFDYAEAKNKIHLEIDEKQNSILKKICFKDYEILKNENLNIVNEYDILDILKRLEEFRFSIKFEKEYFSLLKGKLESDIINLNQDKLIFEKELKFKEKIIDKINIEKNELSQSFMVASSKIQTLEKTILEIKSELLLLKNENKNIESVFKVEKEVFTHKLLDYNKINDNLLKDKEVLLNEVRLKNQIIDNTRIEINNLETKLIQQKVDFDLKYTGIEEKLIEKSEIILKSKKINFDLESSLKWYRHTYENRSIFGIVKDKLLKVFKD